MTSFILLLLSLYDVSCIQLCVGFTKIFILDYNDCVRKTRFIAC